MHEIAFAGRGPNSNRETLSSLEKRTTVEDFKEAMEYARNTYEWNRERTRLARKSDGMVVAELVPRKGGVWLATNKSGKRTTRIGEFEDLELARHAVDVAFGLVIEDSPAG